MDCVRPTPPAKFFILLNASFTPGIIINSLALSAFNSQQLFFLFFSHELGVRFELTTSSLPWRRSTTELSQQKYLDLNIVK